MSEQERNRMVMRELGLAADPYRFDGEPFESVSNGGWTLHRLTDGEGCDSAERWSIGKFGPRMYLNCDEDTAIMVLDAIAAKESK
jgi:hypothetical protein